MSSAGAAAGDTHSRAGTVKAVVTSPHFIAWTALAFMTTSSVASLRPAPTMAVYGLAAVFLYVVAAIVFLVPTSLVSAELASGWDGGIYNWVSRGISPQLGFLAVWCQFAMTIFYYPSLLSFVASTFAYVIDPGLASNGLYVAIMIIGIYWLGVLVSARGMQGLAGLASAGLFIGTLIPSAAQAALVSHLKAVAPWHVKLEIHEDEPGAPFAADTSGPAYATMRAAMQEAYGKTPTTAGQGGSIPLTNVLREAFPQAEIMLYGIEEPKCLIHAPNESVDPTELEHDALTEALFLQQYAGVHRA